MKCTVQFAGVFLLLAATVTSGALAERKSVDSMGEWRLLPVEGREMAAPVPAVDDTWQTYTAPGLWTDNVHDSAWLVRTVEIAPEDIGKVFQFRFLSATYHARLFVNGQFIGEHRGGDSPFFITVPDGVFKAGTNVIALGMTNASSGLKDGQCMIRDLKVTKAQNRQWSSFGDQAALAFKWWLTEIGLLQKAQLLILPRVYVDDIFVKTSTRKMRLEAEVEVVNATTEPQTVILGGQALDGDTVAKKFWDNQWTLAPGERKVMTIAGSWTDVTFWSPGNPKLYHFRATVSLKEQPEQIIDQDQVRFGFREVWIENCRIILNGAPVFFGGASITRYGDIFTYERAYELLKGRKEIWHSNMTRTHHDLMEQCFLDAADELGMTILVQNAYGYGSARESNPAWWADATRQFLEYIKLSRNHPSVVIWSTDNEGTFIGGGPKMDAPSVPFLIDMMYQVRRLDPTRLVTSSHNLDLRGHSDFLDAGYCTHGEFRCFPVEMLRFQSWFFDMNKVWDRVKPICIDEWGEMFGLDPTCVDFGDVAFWPPVKELSIPNLHTFWTRYHQAWGQYVGIMETRKQNATSVLLCFGDRLSAFPYEGGPRQLMGPEIVECAHKNYASIVAFPRELYRGYYAGERMTLPYLVINESERELEGLLRWRLVTGQEIIRPKDGEPWQIEPTTAKEVGKGQIPLRLAAGERKSYDIVCALPSSANPQPLSLAVELWEGERLLYSDQQQYSMVPRTDLRGAPAFALVGERETRTRFAELGANCTLAPVGTAVASGRPVVVGVEAMLSPEEWQALDRFVAGGGKLLVLARRGLPATFGGVPLEESGRDIVRAHNRAPLHPVMKGFGSQDFRWWRDDYLISDNALGRPHQGNFRVLIDAGRAWYFAERGEGLSLTPLLEVVAGRGKALFCSLFLQERAAKEPAAALLLRRILDYLRTDGKPLLPAVSWGVDLSGTGAELLPPESALSPQTVAVVVANGGQAPSSAQAARLANYVRAGGQALIDQVKPETAAAWGQALSLELSATPINTRWLYFDPQDSAFWGMSHYDTFWVYGKRHLIEQQGQITEAAVASASPQVQVVAEPGAILLARLGQGKVIFSQVRWNAPLEGKYIQDRANDYIIQLLTNLGVKLTPKNA